MDESRQDEWKRYLQLAASGALTGAVFGGVGRILGGSRRLSDIGVGAGLGTALGGVSIPAATYVGEAILGRPDADDTQPYTARAALGGGLSGAVAGATGASLLQSGLGKKIGEIAPSLARFAKANIPTNNIVGDWIKTLPLPRAALAGGVVGALGLGALAADEGQQIDTIKNILDTDDSIEQEDLMELMLKRRKEQARKT